MPEQRKSNDAQLLRRAVACLRRKAESDWDVELWMTCDVLSILADRVDELYDLVDEIAEEVAAVDAAFAEEDHWYVDLCRKSMKN